jgi:KUP system potassium uptake protein
MDNGLPSIDIRKLTWAGFLISVGIVYGDIGTSPLYTFKAILQQHPVDQLIVLGSVSAIFWTLTLQTTFKYVFITLKADNHGEGGIFALYTLIRRYGNWLVIPAILGGCFLIADSIITPPISISAAVEGLKMQYPSIAVIPIVLLIIIGLFLMQALGTSRIGKIFGPAMMVWFTMIGVMGVYALTQSPGVIKALNPWYAWQLLSNYPGGFWFLGGVFLCTTGAEALYSDLGHCGRKNIEISWIYIKTCLVLCYFGQAAWLVNHEGMVLGNLNSFFAMMPGWMFWPAVIIATMAAIIASQALISGTFTLFNEAIRLHFFPRLLVRQPSEVKGQLYIPSVNWFLMLACCGVVLYFRESANMEAAFGLSVTLTMLMTTILLSVYLAFVLKKNKVYVTAVISLFLTVEIAFLVANLQKFYHGGYVTLLLGVFIFWIMFTWFWARNIKQGLVRFQSIKSHLPILRSLSRDVSLPKYATHLVYLTSMSRPERIEEDIMRSIYYQQPKRADIYWFVHIEVMDEPYTSSFKVDFIEPDEVIRITFYLGFRIVPNINVLFNQVLTSLHRQREIDVTNMQDHHYHSNPAGDYRFIVLKHFLSADSELPFWKKIPLQLYFMLKTLDLTAAKAYSLDYSRVTTELVPLVVGPPTQMTLKRLG